MPDVALHGAEQRRAIGQKVVVAEEQEGVPGVVERRLDGVDRVRPAWPSLPLVSKIWGHFEGTTLDQIFEGMLTRRGNDPGELAPFDPGGIEHLDASPILYAKITRLPCR